MSLSKENKYPEIRFKGFTEAWEQRKLGEIAKIYDGTHQTPKYTNSGIMFLSVENIHNLSSNKFISKQAFEKEFKVRPEKGDILMTRIGSIGVANVVENDIPVAYYVSLALIKSKLNPHFLRASIHSPFVQDELWKKTLHIAFPKKINKNEITKVVLKFPDPEEQYKIGYFLKKLDDTIALHQCKLDRLENLKKAYLQVLLPNIEEKTPKMRFTNFNESWEQRKLEDISTYIRGSFPQPYTNPKFYDEKDGKPFVQVADIGFDLKLNADTKAHISKLAEPKSRFVKAGKVIVALQGSIEKSIGRTAITQYDAYFDRTILIFEDYKIPVDKQYFAQVIKALFEREKERAWGATISTITKKHLNNFIIGVPSIEEQKQIGMFFKQLDNNIALHQEKLDKLFILKKAYLKMMFI